MTYSRSERFQLIRSPSVVLLLEDAEEEEPDEPDESDEVHGGASFHYGQVPQRVRLTLARSIN